MLIDGDDVYCCARRRSVRSTGYHRRSLHILLFDAESYGRTVETAGSLELGQSVVVKGYPRRQYARTCTHAARTRCSSLHTWRISAEREIGSCVGRGGSPASSLSAERTVGRDIKHCRYRCYLRRAYTLYVPWRAGQRGAVLGICAALVVTDLLT